MLQRIASNADALVLSLLRYRPKSNTGNLRFSARCARNMVVALHACSSRSDCDAVRKQAEFDFPAPYWDAVSADAQDLIAKVYRATWSEDGSLTTERRKDSQVRRERRAKRAAEERALFVFLPLPIHSPSTKATESSGLKRGFGGGQVLRADPEERLSATQCLEHSWLAGSKSIE